MWLPGSVIAGACCGGGGEGGVAGGEPAHAGEPPGADHECGVVRVVVVLVGPAGRQSACGCPGVAGVVAAGLAEPAEGDRVAAGFGGQVAAEAEHVDPPAPAPVGLLTAGQGGDGGSAGQLPQGGLQPAQVVVPAVVVGGEVGGGFGGVFGDVGGDRFGVQLRPVGVPVGGAGDRAGVELGAEPEPPRLIVGVDRPARRRTRGRRRSGRDRPGSRSRRSTRGAG